MTGQGRQVAPGDDRLSEEMASLRRTLEEQGRLLEERGRRLEKHFEGDEEFQGGLARDVRAVSDGLTALRLDFEKYKAGDEARQTRWRQLLDPDAGGNPNRPMAPVKVELNGVLKQIVAAAAGAGGVTWLVIEGAKYVAQHWAGK